MKPLGLTCVIFKELVPNDEVMPSVLLQHLLSHLTSNSGTLRDNSSGEDLQYCFYADFNRLRSIMR